MKTSRTRALTAGLKNLSLIVLGSVVLAFGTAIFIVPFDLIMGGVTGVAIALAHLLSFPVSVDGYVAILTWALFFLGLFLFGSRFAWKTFLSALIYPLALWAFSFLVSPSVLGGFFFLRGAAHAELALLLAALFGGAFVGVGCALTFLGGGSTGGTDILAFALCRAVHGLSHPTAVFLVDAAVVFFGMFALSDLALSLLAVLSALVSAVLIGRTLALFSPQRSAA